MDETYFYKQIINATDYSDLNIIYKESLDLVCTIPGIDIVMVYMIDDISGDAVLEACRNLNDEYIKRASIIRKKKGITWKIIEKSELVIFDDVQKTDEIGKAGRILGIRAAVGVPVMIEKRCIGVIWFFSYKPREFNEQLRGLLLTIGRLIGRNVSRIKQKEELLQKNKRLSIISQLSVYLNQISGLDEILYLMDHLMKQIGLVDKKAIYMVDKKEPGKIAKLVAHNGIPANLVNNYSKLKYPNGVTWECIEKGEIVYYPYDKLKGTNFLNSVNEDGIRSVVAIPINMEKDTIGTCNFLSFSRNEYSIDELEFIKALGSQIGLAVVRIKMFDNLKHSSVTDDLSGLYNSGYFHESLNKYISIAERDNSSVSVIVFDLDDFKAINDKYGHLVGDRVINEVGKVLLNSVRKMDIAARYGGDEFAVILPNTGYKLSKKIAVRISKAFEQLTVKTDNIIVKPTLSIGISTYINGMDSDSELINLADRAMYRNKKEKKSILQHYNDIMLKYPGLSKPG